MTKKVNNKRMNNEKMNTKEEFRMQMMTESKCQRQKINAALRTAAFTNHFSICTTGSRKQSIRHIIGECLTMNNTDLSLRGTKQSRNCQLFADGLDCFTAFAMTGERLFAGVLDCFGRASLAMTRAWGMTDKRLFAGVLDCFVPRNDESARDDERLFASVQDCFVPRNDESASDDERLFADVLDCFVPRNDESASDDKRLFAGILDCFNRSTFAKAVYWKNNCQWLTINYQRWYIKF
jgi:hypothetical protein